MTEIQKHWQQIGDKDIDHQELVFIADGNAKRYSSLGRLQQYFLMAQQPHAYIFPQVMWKLTSTQKPVTNVLTPLFIIVKNWKQQDVLRGEWINW